VFLVKQSETLGRSSELLTREYRACYI